VHAFKLHVSASESFAPLVMALCVCVCVCVCVCAYVCVLAYICLIYTCTNITYINICGNKYMWNKHTHTHKHTQQGINVVMTPHIGGVTELSRDKMSKVFVDNVPAFFTTHTCM
jgi:hypothetical protein